MSDPKAAMLAFLKLAGVSQARKHLPQRDKFLVLAGQSAEEAGFPSVSERCRQLILANNPGHMLHKYESYSDALADENFTVYVRRLSRFCSYERAEHLLTQLDIAPGMPTTSSLIEPEAYALLLLGRVQKSTAGESGAE